MEPDVKFPILAVVYDLDFIFRVRNTFPENAGVDVHVCRTWEEAKLYLRGVGVYDQRMIYPLPRLILLDTLAPDGADNKLLNFLRKNETFANVPVVLLIADPQQPGLQDLLDQGANAIIAKRESASELLEIFQNVRAMADLTRPVPSAGPML